MAKLIYSAIASLDGCIEDAEGSFDWSTPDEELHGYINEFERPIGTHVYGRRMYETMAFWETAEIEPGEPEVFADYARIWRAADKVVFSRSLGEIATARTRLEREFTPEVVESLKRSARSDISIGGAELAGQALAAGLVDELHLFVCPVIIGGGKRLLPGGVRQQLALLFERRFGNGVVHLHYRVSR